MSDLTRDEFRALLRWGKVTVWNFLSTEHGRKARVSWDTGGNRDSAYVDAEWVTGELSEQEGLSTAEAVKIAKALLEARRQGLIP